ncbi:MAG TPA: fibronectin type III domain-containing protein, partial [Candidatus Limnocylindrales bacterium]|nr:fibronectin type III domain-containing protein [Candidatus Limnocylindrales bacterium]
LSRLDRRSRAAVTAVMAALLIGAPGAPGAPVLAAETPDPSDVVIVLDFSASILDEPTDRNRFAAALDRIADRVDETSADLIVGDTTVSIVQFASRAADYPRCAELKLLGSPAAVARFASCLRSVARAYRTGLGRTLTKRIGVDTNYVAAMDRAATHLPADAVRPALILFTDGRHDVRGVPASQVRVTRERLFGSRSPFALMPVGMGLDAAERPALERGLVGMRVVREMPPCVSGTTFDWPQVVFDSPADAGNAVAVALQNATCTFTVVPPPPPAPAPIVGAVRGIRLSAQNGAIELRWTAPVATPTSDRVVDYRARCRTGGGDWIEAKNERSLETEAVVEGLTNGVPYECQVTAVGAESSVRWTAATDAVAPLAPPDAPGVPAVQASSGSLQLDVTPATSTGVSGYRYECSDDGGATWTWAVQVGASDPTGQIPVRNGVQYICRAYATNSVGVSPASAVSPAVFPCGSALECNPILQPILAVLGALLAAGLLAVFVMFYRRRPRGYVVAVVDVVHSVNLGSGSRLGLEVIRDPATRTVTGVVPSRGPKPDIRVRQLRGGRFEVTDRRGRHVANAGEPIVAIDANGGRHQLVLHPFER